MFKKGLLILLLLTSFSVWAASKECAIKPNYDIIINKDFVQVVNLQHNLIISPTGKVSLDGQEQSLSTSLQKETYHYQLYLHEQLPLFKYQSIVQLNQLRDIFQQAIRTKLDNDSELMKPLNRLYKQLLALLDKTIVSQNDQIIFYHKHFNNIKKEGENIASNIFYNIVGSSIVNLNVFKNYSAIKQIAKNEWKSQKEPLKQFEKQVCDLLTNIDQQYLSILQKISINKQ